MEGVLWYVLASSRGGPTRTRIVRTLDERPRNANELAEEPIAATAVPDSEKMPTAIIAPRSRTRPGSREFWRARPLPGRRPSGE